MITLEQQGSTLLIRLDDGKANTLDTENLNAFADRLHSVRESPARSVVLTGAGEFFSAGVNLHRVLEEDPGYAGPLLLAVARALGELFCFPRPVVAAVNGHAVAGGCLLVCACDYRLVARGGARLGFPEVRAGLPMVGISLELARWAVPRRYLAEVLYHGDLYGPEAALERGLVDQVVEPEDLLKLALEEAARLGAIPAETFGRTKEGVRESVVRRIEEGWARFAEETPAVWASEAVRQRLCAYVKETLCT